MTRSQAQPVPFAPRAMRRVEALLAGLDLRAVPGGYVLEAIDLDQAVGLVLDGPDGPLYVELDLAPGPAYARTRHYRVTYQFPGHPRITARAQAALDAVVAAIRAGDTEALPAATGEIDAPAIRRVRVDRVLGTSPNAPTDYHLNPYVGCTIGCVYCNAKFRAEDVRRLDGRGGRGWGRWLDVKVNAPEVLAEEVRRVPPGTVCFSPVVTDPYVASERRHRITRGCLEVLADAGFSAVILTRSAVVLDDLPLLGRLAGAAVGVSIPSDDAAAVRRLEPGGLDLEGRHAVLEAARAAGLSTFAVVQPAFPRDPEAFIRRLAPLVDAVRVDGLHEVARVGHHFEGLPLADVPSLTEAFAAAGVPTELSGLMRHPAGRSGTKMKEPGPL